MSNSLANSQRQFITCDTALGMLVAVFPALQQQWTDYIKTEYPGGSYKAERLNYVDIILIIRFIIEKKTSGETAGFRQFFNEVESIIEHGDEQTVELIVIGLLEGIQNACGHELDYRTGFDAWLLPLTKESWDGVIEFWEEKQPPSMKRFSKPD